MKTKILITLTLVTSAAFCSAQSPGNPSDNGLTPKTRTFDVNTNYNNTSTESTGVAIAANGNVLIGWEDDGPDILDQEAIWSLFSATGSLLTSPTTVTNFDGSMSLSNYTYRAFFRANGSPMPGYAAWGPKIKANLFGNGLGMGATGFGFDIDVADPVFEAVQKNAAGANAGDFPAVQLLNNDGTPGARLSGMADADAEPDGDVRVGDWEYLSNGNIVIVGESRQADDFTRFGFTTGGNFGAVYRIVTPAGVEVKAYSAVSSATVGSSIWHGVGVTSNGFAVRFDQGGTKVRMFDNAGNPTTTNIDIATLTGKPETAGGGRGDGAGFHGNGKDAYVIVNSGGGTPWVTVLNANGTLRYARKVADGGDAPNSDRVDGAISSDGRVLVVFDSITNHSATVRLPQGRLFAANGDPLGGIFWISERDNATNTAATAEARRPRVAWRGNDVAIIWETLNSPTTVDRVVAARLFTVPPPPVAAITTVVETGGDNEPTDTITAKWTGQTFPVSVANEPVPGAVIGNNYTVGTFGNGAPTFVDRNHRYTNASDTVLIPSYLAGGEYIMSGNDNRDNASYLLNVTVSQSVLVYLLIDNRLGDTVNSNPPTFSATNMQWVLDQGWAAVKTGNNRTADVSLPDEVGIDESADGTINNWYSVYRKSFPSGTFQLKQADNAGQNMYGVVITAVDLTGATVQDPGNVVGTGTNAWSYLVLEGEDYDSEADGNPDAGFVRVTGGGARTNALGNPVLAADTTASKKGALFAASPIFGQHADKATYKVLFNRPGTYYLYMRFTMFENGGNLTHYLNEDSFFVPPGFDKDPATDWPLINPANGQNQGYTEGCCDLGGFLFIPTVGDPTRVSHTADTDFWEGDFHWNQLLSSQFLVSGTSGEPAQPHKYEVTSGMVGVPQTFTISYREAGVTIDLFLFSTHTNLLSQYTQAELDQLLLGGGGTPSGLVITNISVVGQAVSLAWTGGTAPYLVQKKSSLTNAAWVNVLTTQNQNAAVPLQGDAGFLRVVDNAQTNVVLLTGFLSGDAERPNPTTTGASGLGSASLEGNTLTYNVTFSGLSSPATAAHIHMATNTSFAAPVVIPFTVGSVTSGTISGSATVTDAQKAALLAGLAYFNIHTANFGGGEIRGQIGPSQLKASLSPTNEPAQQPPIVSNGTGSATLTRIGNTVLYNITYSGLSSAASAGHIHGPAPPGMTANVVNPFPDVSGTSGTLTGSLTLGPVALAAVVDGLAYVNIHTANYPGGEIRGQITP